MSAVSEMTDLCRLCLRKNNLVSIFKKNNQGHENMKDIVYITTGVQIYTKDCISQKICEKCSQLSLKMYQFRLQSQENDQKLKEQWRKYLKSSHLSINTNASVKSEKIDPKKLEVKKEIKPEVKKEIKPEVKTEVKPEPSKEVKPETSKEVKPVMNKEVKPEPSKIVKPEIKKMKLETNIVKPETNKQVKPEVNKLKPDVNTHVKPEANKVKPDANTQVKPDVNKVKPDVNKVKPDVNKIKPDVNQVKPEINKVKPQINKEVKPVTHEIINPKIHPSVGTLYTMYTNILLPSIVLKSNLLPYVSMQLDEVETYYKKHNINMQDHVQYGLKSYRKSLSHARKSLGLEKDKVELPSDKKTEATSQKTKLNINKHGISGSAAINTVVRKSTSAGTSKLDEGNIKKRKLSLSDSPIPEKKPAFVESLGLTPTKIKEITLLNCDICNSVHYNPRELKRHRLNHLRCQFCKVRFKSMELKHEHIDKSCIVKHTMNNLPSIVLKKIEFDLETRKKYRPAFIDFSSIPGLDDIQVVPPQSNLSENKIVAQATDVIEILSDDESSTVKIENRVNTPNTTYTPLVQNTNKYDANTSSSIVKPDIIIKHFNFMDVVDGKSTDLEILKQLLKFHNKFQISSNQYTQTELPDNSSIHINPYEITADLENLKQQLHVFKVPVEINSGSSFQVCYNYENPIKKSRKCCVWNDLKPIDVKTPIYANVYKPILPKQNANNKAPTTSANQVVTTALNTNDSTPILTSQVNRPANTNSQSTSSPVYITQGSSVSNKNKPYLPLHPLQSKPPIYNSSSTSSQITTTQHTTSSSTTTVSLGNTSKLLPKPNTINGYVLNNIKATSQMLSVLKPQTTVAPMRTANPIQQTFSVNTTQAILLPNAPTTNSFPNTPTSSFAKAPNSFPNTPSSLTNVPTTHSLHSTHTTGSLQSAPTTRSLQSAPTTRSLQSAPMTSSSANVPTTNSFPNIPSSSFTNVPTTPPLQNAPTTHPLPKIPITISFSNTLATMAAASTVPVMTPVTTYRNSVPPQQPILQITFPNTISNQVISTHIAPPVACVNNASLSTPNSTYTYTYPTTQNQPIGSNIPSTVVTSTPNPSSAAPMPGSIRVKNVWELK